MADRSIWDQSGLPRAEIPKSLKTAIVKEPWELDEILPRLAAFPIVGLDCEFAPDQSVVLIQICSPDECIVIQSWKMRQLPKSLVDFLQDPQIFKAGAGIVSDFSAIRDKYGIETQGCTDLGSLCSKYGPRYNGLDGLAASMLGLYLPKESPGHHYKKNLSVKEATYAILDAYISLRVAHAFYKLHGSSTSTITINPSNQNDDLGHFRLFRSAVNPLAAFFGCHVLTNESGYKPPMHKRVVVDVSTGGDAAPTATKAPEPPATNPHVQKQKDLHLEILKLSGVLGQWSHGRAAAPTPAAAKPAAPTAASVSRGGVGVGVPEQTTKSGKRFVSYLKESGHIGPSAPAPPAQPAPQPQISTSTQSAPPTTPAVVASSTPIAPTEPKLSRAERRKHLQQQQTTKKENENETPKTEEKSATATALTTPIVAVPKQEVEKKEEKIEKVEKVGKKKGSKKRMHTTFGEENAPTTPTPTPAPVPTATATASGSSEIQKIAVSKSEEGKKKKEDKKRKQESAIVEKGVATTTSCVAEEPPKKKKKKTGGAGVATN